MAQKKIWIIVVVVVVALIAVKVIATLSKRTPKTVEQSLAQQQVLPTENAMSVSDVNAPAAASEPQPAASTAAVASSAVPSASAPAAAETAVGNPSANPAIIDVQTALKNAGFDPGSPDGKMGKKTKSAIREFQKANGLNSDGKVGPKTWLKLSKFLTTSAVAQ